MFKKFIKKATTAKMETLDSTQLKNVLGGVDEAEKVTFKAKEGATAEATVTDTTTRSIQDESKSFTSIIR